MQIWPPTLENVQGLNPIVDEIILSIDYKMRITMKMRGVNPGSIFAKSWIQPRMVVVVVVVPPCESNTYELWRLRHGIVGV